MEVEPGFRVEGEVLGDGTPNLPDVERVATAADQAPPTRCAVARPSTPSSAAVQFEDGPEWVPSPDYALGKCLDTANVAAVITNSSQMATKVLSLAHLLRAI